MGTLAKCRNETRWTTLRVALRLSNELLFISLESQLGFCFSAGLLLLGHQIAQPAELRQTETLCALSLRLRLPNDDRSARRSSSHTKRSSVLVRWRFLCRELRLDTEARTTGRTSHRDLAPVPHRLFDPKTSLGHGRSMGNAPSGGIIDSHRCIRYMLKVHWD